MKYGLIGEHLGHSFSKEIHNLLGNRDYELCEVSRDDLNSFMLSKEFLGINVTIPYKQEVIPYLDSIDDAAKMIGAVNTIVNNNGKLCGYNTDFYGLKSLIEKNNVPIKDNNVYILGTGGTSKTARAVATSLGAKSIHNVSTHPKDAQISYEELFLRNDVDVIINATPVGMFPNNDTCLINLKNIKPVKGVVDVVYNPLQTNLVYQARNLKIPACGGLYMLVGQAVAADAYFFNKEMNKNLLDKIYNEVLQSKENIVLIGMPSSGKSTIGKTVAEKTGKQFVDCDEYLVNKYGISIPEIFEKQGEKIFREYESEVIKEVAKLNNCVISTGGGSILNENNVVRLKQNGRIFFIDRDLELLIPTNDRPTANSADMIKKRYLERYDLYCKYSDCLIKNNESIDKTIDQILEKII